MDPIALVGGPAPDFALPDLDGSMRRLADQRGAIVVLNFWSAECPHSERVDHRIMLLRADWEERVQVWWVAANANEDGELLRQSARARRLGPVLRDAGQSLADRYGAQTTPHLFVIDARGIVRYAGAADDVTFRQRVATRDYLAEAVRAVLRGQAPEPSSTPAFGCAIVRRGAPA
jgi:peroxiredoxin